MNDIKNTQSIFIEKNNSLSPNFSKSELLPVIAQCADSGVVLMLAYMNKDAWELSLKTGEAHYFSRSRNKIWHKGESSGHVQRIKNIRIDCDEDTILLLVEQKGGAACHVGYKSCFYRERAKNAETLICSELIFDPKEIYK
ncbi:phosphoribosyl-AMP cyclohydrolase [Desulfovibrio litoralis]|uniref:Phosphoribosyl-AMP cyclohydrolase n=1 Tax=Desulfovibrio litoralis DSM 11393 TaxID=1121455 RepID=A0A1M7SBX3_9BACT|nr:phosphoribosyl-AMP cyclohydrolase [Desulfovibrio litoralis]SHN55914.1 phosphoribosyl-AMP cyclohydrolase [Desulfovibrio litoralis DSM 11393]